MIYFTMHLLFINQQVCYVLLLKCFHPVFKLVVLDARVLIILITSLTGPVLILDKIQLGFWLTSQINENYLWNAPASITAETHS